MGDAVHIGGTRPERLEKETQAAYRAFLAWLEMGEIPYRVLAARLNRTEESIKHMAKRNHWRERAKALRVRGGALVGSESLVAMDAEEAEKWAKRRRDVREREWAAHERLFELAQVVLQRAERDPAFPRVRDITAVVELAFRLGHLAAGLPENTALTGGAEQLAKQLDRVYPEDGGCPPRR